MFGHDGPHRRQLGHLVPHRLAHRQRGPRAPGSARQCVGQCSTTVVHLLGRHAARAGAADARAARRAAGRSGAPAGAGAPAADRSRAAARSWSSSGPSRASSSCTRARSWAFSARSATNSAHTASSSASASSRVRGAGVSFTMAAVCPAGRLPVKPSARAARPRYPAATGPERLLRILRGLGILQAGPAVRGDDSRARRAGRLRSVAYDHRRRHRGVLARRGIVSGAPTLTTPCIARGRPGRATR